MNACRPLPPGSYPYVSSLVCAFFMCLTPLWIVISSKHPASRTLLYSGWEPVITAMVISRCVFSLPTERKSSCASAAQRLVGSMTHPRDKLQHMSADDRRVPWSPAASQIQEAGRASLLTQSLVISKLCVGETTGFITGARESNPPIEEPCRLSVAAR